MAAVDGHRLAWNKSDLQSTKQTTVIVPPETLISVAAIVKGSLDFFVSFNDRHVTFRSNNTEIASNLIEGPYPDINQIIPTNHGTVLLVDKQPLMDAIDRLAITADDLTHKIHFAISEKQLLLSSEKADSGRRATESLECELIGKKLEIAFNLLYLANILKYIETQKIRIEMTGPMNATIFRPVDISEYFYLIMPLRYE
jgi:DNA polymerase-3 subunit beta